MTVPAVTSLGYFQKQHQLIKWFSMKRDLTRSLILSAGVMLALCGACDKKAAQPEPAPAENVQASTEAAAAEHAQDAPEVVSAEGEAVKPGALYDFTVKSWEGKDIALKNYSGKVILIVNTAIACGFTPQYEGLEALYKKYHDKGLEILDFPCNQFGAQAPGTDAEIHDFRINEYKVSFPQFAKIDVNGGSAAPLYRYLVSLKGFAGFDPASELSAVLDGVLSKSDPDYKNKPDIKWNFTKFLFGRDGKLIGRYEPTTTPEALDKILEPMFAE